MNQIKFRAWNKTHNYMQDFNSHKSGILYSCGSFDVSSGYDSLDEPTFEDDTSEEWVIMQYFDLQDKSGVDYCVGDLVNVFFTSNNGEHIHDCIYEVRKGALGGIELRIRAMMWESYGWNQDTLQTTLCERYSRLSEDYLNRGRLMLEDSCGENHMTRDRWKEIDESRYFVIIGNIHQHSELIK